MFYKAPRRKNIIQVDEETFATLEDIREYPAQIDGLEYTRWKWYKFKFRYSIPIYDVFKHNVFSVRVRVLTRVLTLRELVSRVRGRVLTRQLINRVLWQMVYARNLRSKQSQFTVAKRLSDVSAYVNNETVNDLRRGARPEDIASYRRKKLMSRQVSDFQERGESKAILGGYAWRNINNANQITRDDFTSQFYSRSLMHDMIIKRGIDPSYIASMSHRSSTSRQAVGGLLRKTRSLARSTDVETDPQTRLLYSHIFRTNQQTTVQSTEEISEQQAKIQTYEEEPKTHFEIPVEMWLFSERMRTGNNDNTNLVVKFDLIHNRTGMTIDEVVIPLEIEKHIENYRIPTEPPEMKLARAEDLSKFNIELTVRDKKTRKVRLFQKRIHRNSPKVNDYVAIGDYELSQWNKTQRVPIIVPVNDHTIYRAVPMGTADQLSYEFTSIVAKPQKVYPIKAVSLVTGLEEAGMGLELRNIPPDVISVQFLVRDLTIFEKNWRPISSPKSIDDPTRQIDLMTITDGKVKHQHIYEYTTKLFYKAGDTEYAGHAVTEFIKPESGIVATEISGVEIDQDTSEPNVRFQINTTLLDDNIDMLTNLLKIRELEPYFAGAIENERDLFKKLVAHNVQRINLTTGEREDFGIITDEVFNDLLYHKANAVKPLDTTCQYRYEVYPLLRSPETLFENLNKTKLDDVTKKPYSYNPAKFLHPVTLSRGMIVTPTGRRTLFSKQEMSHGVVGNVSTVDAQFEGDPATIRDVQVTRIDYNTFRLEWQISGVISQIDHFLIIKDVLGVRTIIGKVHSEFVTATAFYLHKIGPDDVGQFKYSIVPVFNDYTIGTEEESELIEVNV